MKNKIYKIVPILLFSLIACNTINPSSKDEDPTSSFFSETSIIESTSEYSSETSTLSESLSESSSFSTTSDSKTIESEVVTSNPPEEKQTVNKSELKALNEKIITTIYDCDLSSIDKETYGWDSQYGVYWGAYISGTSDEGFTLYNSVEEFIDYFLPEGFFLVGNIEKYVWEDDDEGYSATCNDGRISIIIATYSLEEDIVVQYEIFPNEDVELIDDLIDSQDEQQEVFVNFYNALGADKGASKEILVDTLKTLINKAADRELMLDGSVESCQIMAVDAIEKFSCLTIGASKSAGVLTLNFAKNIKTITIIAETYNKTYMNNSNQETVSMDNESIIYINNEDNVMDLRTTDKPKTLTSIFEINSSSITIFNNNGKERVFIKSITLTF